VIVTRATIIALVAPLVIAAIVLIIVVICLATRQPAEFHPTQLRTV